MNREQTERAHARGLRAQASAARHVANAGAGPCSSPGVADDECVRLRAHMWHSGRSACSMQPIWASISLNHIFARDGSGCSRPGLDDGHVRRPGAFARPRVHRPRRERGCAKQQMPRTFDGRTALGISRCCGTSPKRPARTRAQHECIRCEHDGGRRCSQQPVE